jgi:hypothetical protein
VSLAHSQKTHVELVKGKQKVHQIHVANDGNLQVENMFRFVLFINGVASIVSPILHPFTPK